MWAVVVLELSLLLVWGCCGAGAAPEGSKNLTATILFEFSGKDGLLSRDFILEYDHGAKRLETGELWLCHHAIYPPGSVECLAVGPDDVEVTSILTLKPSPAHFYNTQVYLVRASHFFPPVDVPLLIKDMTGGGSGDREVVFRFHARFPMVLESAYRLAHRFCSRHHVTPDPHHCADSITKQVALRFKQREPVYMVQHSFLGRPQLHPGEHEAEGGQGSCVDTAAVVPEDDVWVVVNSNCRFANRTLSRLLPALREAGWASSNVHVGMGGCDEAGTEMQQAWGAATTMLQPMGEDLMDFNAMAALLHLLIRPDRPPVLPRYVFYLHDTVEVGPSFKQALLREASRVVSSSSTSLEGVLGWPLLYPMSMNIGLYSTAALMEHAPAILARLASYSHLTSPSDRKRAMGHGLEDFILHWHGNEPPPHHCLCPELTVLPPERGHAGGGVPRARLWCRALDLIKLQSTYPGAPPQQYNNTEL